MKYLILISIIFTFLSCSKFDSTKINCNDDKECPNNHICYKSQCFACELDEYFNDEKGKCVNYCEENATLCGEGQTCHSGRVNLLNNQNIPAYWCECNDKSLIPTKQKIDGQVINLCIDTKKCPKACSAEETCEPIDGEVQKVCDSGFCKNSCENNRDCDIQLGETCNNGFCSIVDCFDNEICFNGACFPKTACSPENPEGECPSRGIEDKFICVEGMCVLQQTETISVTKDDCSFNIEDISDNSCSQGYICTGSNPFEKSDGVGNCVPFCDLRYNNCPENGECLPFSMIADSNSTLGSNSNNSVYQNVGVCFTGNCRNDSECKDSKQPACKYFTDKLSICMPKGPRTEGLSCSNKLGENLSCIGDLACVENTCIDLCDIDKNNCALGSICLAAINEYNGQYNRQIGACFKSCTLLKKDETYYYNVGRDGVCGSGSCFNLDITQSEGFCNLSSCNDENDCGSLSCSLGENLMKSCKKINANTKINTICNPTLDTPLSQTPQCGIDMVCSPTNPNNLTEGKCIKYCIPDDMSTSDDENCAKDEEPTDNYSCFDLGLFEKNLDYIAPNTFGLCAKSCEFVEGEENLLFVKNDNCTDGVCMKSDFSNEKGMCEINNCTTVNCSAAGKKCSLNFLGLTDCKVIGNKKIGDTCVNSDQCGINMVCDDSKTCTQLCKPNNEILNCPTDYSCFDISNVIKNPLKFEKDITGICISDAGLCLFDNNESTFNIAANKSCTDGICIRNDSSINKGICQTNECNSIDICAENTCSLTYLGISQCVKVGTKEIGDECDLNATELECVKDSVCILNKITNKGKCTQLCNPNDENLTCPVSLSCTDVSTIPEYPYKFEQGISWICASPAK